MKIKIYQDHTHAGELTKADPINGTEIDLPDDDAKQVLDSEGLRRAEIINAAERIQEIQSSPIEAIK